MNERTLARVWWIDEEAKVLGGMYPGSILPELAQAYGVTAYLNLQESNETNFEGVSFPDYAARADKLADDTTVHLRVAIPDMGTPLDAADVDLALDFLLANEHRTVYTHCWGGHGRTGLIAACYLKCVKGHSVEEAFEQIERRRLHSPYLSSIPSPQTDIQRAFVRNYEYGGLNDFTLS